MSRKRYHDSFEDVELERGWRVPVMDSSIPLLIDATPRVAFSIVLAFVAIELLVVVIVSICVPKDRYVDNSIYRVRSAGTDSAVVYEFDVSELTDDSTRLWLSVLSVRGATHPLNYDNISLATEVRAFANSSAVSTTRNRRDNIMFYYWPHSHCSETASGVSIPIRSVDRVSIAVALTFHSPSVEAVVFEWSTNNPSNRAIGAFAARMFASISVIYVIVLLRSVKLRLEQMGTILSLLLFGASSFCLTSESLVFHCFEKVMVCALRVFLFYLIAYIANKHRNFLTKMGFFLIFVSLLLDIGIAWNSWKKELLMMHGHNIAVHMLVICGTESLIGAMSFSSEDHFSFFVYSLLISLSFAATLVTHDWCIIAQNFQHYIEPRIAFYGVHAVILAVLVYFHQGMCRTASDGNKLEEEWAAGDRFGL
jgi:hypothetical protein